MRHIARLYPSVLRNVSRINQDLKFSNMQGPTISIIVPIYGVEKYIRQCADTVLGQTYPNIQFIIVNDGTKDNSMQVLEELIEEKYQHLRPAILIVN